MNKEKYNIICLSNQFYQNQGFSWTNKHIVMSELAKRGHNVIFVDPPTRFRALKMFLKVNRFKLVNPISKNFVVYTPVNVFNFLPFSWLSNKFHTFVIGKILKSFNIPTSKGIKTVLWVYHFDFPRIFELSQDLKPDVFIYDVVDNYEEFPEYNQLDTVNTGLVKLIQSLDNFFKVKIDQLGLMGKRWVKKRERDLAKRADLMFSSHPLLYSKFLKLNKKTYYTPNASLFAKFAKKPKKIPKKLAKISHPRVLFSGSLDPFKVDVDLLIKTAKNTPNVNYVLVGPLNNSDSNKSVNKLKQVKNIYLVDPIPYAEGYAHFFDAYVIPYNINDYTYYGCFPTKFLNALATGVPVVVTDLPCYKGFEDVLYIGKDGKDYIAKVKKAIGDKNKVMKEKRIKVASCNTWEHKVDKQLQAIRDFLN